MTSAWEGCLFVLSIGFKGGPRFSYGPSGLSLCDMVQLGLRVGSAEMSESELTGGCWQAGKRAPSYAS